MLVYVVLLTCFILRNQVYVCLFAHHVHVFVCLSLFHLVSILVGSLERINGLSHFGGVTCFGHLTILKMCVHEEYHLELILQDYLVSLWYVILMRNSNSIMSINVL
jgi:hypothetical protein